MPPIRARKSQVTPKSTRAGKRTKGARQQQGRGRRNLTAVHHADTRAAPEIEGLVTGTSAQAWEENIQSSTGMAEEHVPLTINNKVKFMIVMGSLSMSSTTITHVCAGCMADGIFSKCKVCLAFESEEVSGSLFFQLGYFDGFSLRNIHFTDLCSVCTKNDDEIMECQECTTFVAIKAILDCEPCSDYNPTITEAKEVTEKIMSETQSPSIFEYSPSTLAVEDGTEQATLRTYSRSSFEYVTCPERSPTSTVAEVRSGEETFRTKIQQSSDDLLGYVFGSVLGGVIFGSIITTLVFIVIRQREEKQKREQKSDALHNLAESGINQQLVQDHSQESMRASLNINNKRTRSPEKTTEFITEEDGVYNHLNASETVDRDEYYDHSRAGALVHPENNNDDYDHAGPSFLTVSTIDDYAT